MNVAWFEVAKSCEEYLSVLLWDVEIRKADKPIYACSDPFESHLYCSAVFQDGDREPWSTERVMGRLIPSMASFAKYLAPMGMIETYKWTGPHAWGMSQFYSPGRHIPIRVTVAYNAVLQGTQVSLDLFARHIGNHHRLIINGPMHRRLMPFKAIPEEGHRFSYLYLPFEPLNYEEWDEEQEESLILPRLDRAAIRPESKHTYLVEGDYCYYTGETLTCWRS